MLFAAYTSTYATPVYWSNKVEIKIVDGDVTRAVWLLSSKAVLAHFCKETLKSEQQEKLGALLLQALAPLANVMLADKVFIWRKSNSPE